MGGGGVVEGVEGGMWKQTLYIQIAIFRIEKLRNTSGGVGAGRIPASGGTGETVFFFGVAI